MSAMPISTSAVQREARRIPWWGCLEIRTSETTGPPFCASPTCSSPAAKSPSRWAAICRIAEAVTTPVPPMPGIRIRVASGSTRGSGSTSVTGSAGISRRGRVPGTTVRNDGQSPLRQE